MIDATQLLKRFGERVALAGVSLHVARGEIVGLLGPNGAGKTTTFRILAGVLPPDDGRVAIAGHDLAAAPLAARRCVGFAPERPALREDLRVAHELGFVAALRGVPAGTARHEAVASALASVGLGDHGERRIGALSRGVRQRIGIAAALVGEPPVLLLDEPTAGLDPAQSVETRRLIRALGRERAILVSSHLLADMEALCDRVVIMHHGRVLAEGDPTRLAARLRRNRHVEVEAAATPDRLAALARGVRGVTAVVELPCASGRARCRVEAADDADVAAPLAAAIVGAGIALHALAAIEPSLEDAFLDLTRAGDAPP